MLPKAQRNKLSLQATTSSGISHFRKTHLKRCEVVMLGISYLVHSLWYRNRQVAFFAQKLTIVWIIWFKKYWNLTSAFKMIINRVLLDKMVRLFYCLLFPVRTLKKWKSGWEGSPRKLGNPGRRGVLVIWEIQSAGGSKMLAIHRKGV